MMKIFNIEFVFRKIGFRENGREIDVERRLFFVGVFMGEVFKTMGGCFGIRDVGIGRSDVLGFFF